MGSTVDNIKSVLVPLKSFTAFLTGSAVHFSKTIKRLQINQHECTVCVLHPKDSILVVSLGNQPVSFKQLPLPSSPSLFRVWGFDISLISLSFIPQDIHESLNIGYSKNDRYSTASSTQVQNLKVNKLAQPYLFGIDGIVETKKGESNIVNGWLFGIDPFKITSIQARLDNEILDLEYPIFRADTGVAFPDNAQAQTCGIEIELPLDKADGKLSLEFFTDNDKGTLFFESPLARMQILNTSDSAAQPDASTTPSIEPKFNVDTLFVEQQKKLKTRMLGWLFINDSMKIEAVRARYRNEIISARYGLERPDVQGLFTHDSKAIYSGFEFQFDDIKGNPLIIFEMDLGNEEWIEFDRRKPSQINTTFYTDAKIDEKVSRVKSGVESAQIGRRYGHDFMIVGWCFSIDKQSIERVRIVTKGATFEAELNPSRKDVFAIHGEEFPNSNISGFEIPVDNISRTAKLKFEYLNTKGKWVLFAEEDFSKFPVSHFASHNAEKLDYGKWLKEHDSLLRIDNKSANQLNESLSIQPLISIVLPVYNTPEQYLKQAIESVLNQYYTNWELCIADDASTDKNTLKVLEKYSTKDSRIKVTHRETNGHICLASNSALELTSGEWIAFLDHDDLLTDDALLRVVQYMNLHKEVQLFYSDEDKVDEKNKRHDPYFKPAWNRSLLEGQNMLCHLTVVKKELIDHAGGFEEGMQGSQDWDLFLKITEKLTDKQIRHIPYTLYHWRAIPGSTALALEEKGYIRISSENALKAYCERNKLNAAVEPVAHGHWRIRRHLPTNPPKVSIIIPTKDQVEILVQGIDSIRNLTTYSNYEIIIVNNNSKKPETLQQLEAYKSEGITVLDYPHPFNFSVINNFAVKHAKGEILAFLNNDLSIIDGQWLEEMVSQVLRTGTGAVGAKLYYPEDCIQHAGVILGINGVAGHSFKYAERGEPGQRNRMNLVQELTAVTAACLLVKKEAFLKVKGFEEEHLGVAFNDIDLCLRLHEAGYRNTWTPFAQLYHHESLSRGDDNDSDRKTRVDAEIDYMKKRWGYILRNDPAYNPNLTLEFEDFSFAWPPRLPVHESN